MTLIRYQGVVYFDDVIQVQRIYDGIIHQSLMISISICTQFMLTMLNFWIIFFQTVMLASKNFIRQNARSVDETCRRSRFTLPRICPHKITLLKVSYRAQ